LYSMIQIWSYRQNIVWAPSRIAPFEARKL
jgi:hypothetical protein